MKMFDNVENEKWGYLRESQADASGKDPDTGLHRTGLDTYLSAIFPKTSDWIHDKQIGKLPNGTTSRKRPDYRSESLKMIVEFDGIQHYQSPTKIRSDNEGTMLYRSLGYKVVRIPFFVQLSNVAVKVLFGVDVDVPLFDEKYPSLGPKGVKPADLCWAGLIRMAEEFQSFPSQYAVNLAYLKEANDDFITGASLLDALYSQIKQGKTTIEIKSHLE